MSEQDDTTRKKANRYFFTKVAFNAFLMILGAVLIALFLRQMQRQAALQKQEVNSQQALEEAVETLGKNAQDAEELTQIFHDGNQDMLRDLCDMFGSGLMDYLTDEDNETRAAVFEDIIERAGLEYLFVMSTDRKILICPNPALTGTDVVEYRLLSLENASKLILGTEGLYGKISPVAEHNSRGHFYFYSTLMNYNGEPIVLILGTDASVLDVQLGSLKDIGVVLSRAAVGNDGFMFAVDRGRGSFLYYKNGSEDLTGRMAAETGLSEAALVNGYSGIETINGIRYYCVSKEYKGDVIISAVAQTEKLFINDRYVLFWSIMGFVLVMLLCLIYAVIVRNDFVRHAVDTEKKYFRRKNGSVLILDKSIFKKVFPLMFIGVVLVFCISFYTQTLLEIHEAIEDSRLALTEVTGRYQESIENRGIITKYYDNRFLSKAKLLAFLLEEDPSVLNESTDRYYTAYDENGSRYYLKDDEGNHLRSVGSSEKLKELCASNDIESIYVFNSDGRTIATNSDLWHFTISHNEKDQSYPFLEVLDGRRDAFVQEAMVSDVGEPSQYLGVAFHYYTTAGADGNTQYVSHYAYENQNANGAVTAHRSMLQIGLDQEISKRLLASTDTGYILSSDTLSGGFIVLFDSSEDHVCLWSPREASIGLKASELGVSPKAFTGADYYGFTRINGVRYFAFFRYVEGYFIATAMPKSGMFTSRAIIAAITALTSLILILFLSATVTFTSEEEEHLYATMSESQAKKGFESAIFNIILPSGKMASTVKAAARWDNKRVPWSEKNPEQKLLQLISILAGILIAYVIVTVIGVNYFFAEDSVIKYILSGDWDRGANVFAYSACFLVMVMIGVAVALFRIPVRIVTSLVGARGETIGHLLLSVLKYGGVIGGLFYCLYLLGIDSSSLLASAGILSLVIGLGAQSLIKDILAGIFIVFEGEFRVGDIVTINGYRGTVMDIGLRTTKIMGVDGNIKIYNNSEISGVLNMTKEASIAITRISIEYGQDLDYVEAVLNRDMPAIRENNPQIIAGPVYRGVGELADSGVELVITCSCAEADIIAVTRYMNKEILQIFYRNGINVPFPNVTISNLTTDDRKTMADFKEKKGGEKELSEGEQAALEQLQQIEPQ